MRDGSRPGDRSTRRRGFFLVSLRAPTRALSLLRLRQGDQESDHLGVVDAGKPTIERIGAARRKETGDRGEPRELCQSEFWRLRDPKRYFRL